MNVCYSCRFWCTSHWNVWGIVKCTWHFALQPIADIGKGNDEMTWVVMDGWKLYKCKLICMIVVINDDYV